MNRIYIKFFFLGFCTFFFACKQTSKDPKKDLTKSEKTQSIITLEHKLRLPIVNDGKPYPLLLLLHGLGSNEDDLFTFASHLDRKLMIVSVRAPYQIGPKKFSWYDLDLNGGDFIYSFNELKESQYVLLTFLEELKSQYNIEESKIFLGGFSQGAIMSLATALSHSNEFAGAMVLSGDLLDEVEKEISTKEINPELNIYMSHGRLDQVLSFAEAEKDAKFLNALNIEFQNHWFDSKHSISRENFISLNQWLSSQL